MQDDGDLVVEDSENQSVMENGCLTSETENDVCTTFFGEIDGNDLVEKEDSVARSLNETATLPNDRDLPENLSSNYDNIPLNFDNDNEEISRYVDPARIAKEKDEKFEQLDGGETINLTEVVCPDSHKDEDKIANNGGAMYVEKSISRENSACSMTQLDDSCSRFDENPGEPSIEDSCESRPVYMSGEKRVKDESSLMVENNTKEKRSSLIEDSKLVKISLPTSSINIMQTNAQFLNKSRNFLNFITEKSTNIMEKTLLPQNIAVRYNSIIKTTDGSACAIEKTSNFKESPFVRESSTTILASNSRSDETSRHLATFESPKNDEDTVGETKERFTETRSAELSLESETKSIDGFFTNSRSLASPGEFISTKRDNSSLITCSSSSDASLEVKKESNSKNLDVRLVEKSSVDDSLERSQVSIDTSNGLLRHPVYLTLVRDYAGTREENLKLAERVEILEARNRILEAQIGNESFNVQLEALEKTVERLTVELRGANANQEELGREYAAANKERESMVMKYAVSEKQLIDTQRARDYAERRYKEIAKDHELLRNKLRQAQSERTRICNILDVKCRELADSQKEVERLKEDVNVRDVKLKWTQTKLKTEMESQKETQMKLDKATARINDMRDECEQVRRESQETIRKFQHSEENKAVTLDQQLKEQQARLILERHVTEDKEISRLQLQKEVEMLKNRQLALVEENNTLSLKIQDLEKNRLSRESKLSDFKNLADQRQKEIVDLSGKISQLETLKLQLIHKEQCLMSNEAEVERLRQVNQELQADMDCCRQREAQMLDFTQKLTDKNVRLQSEFTSIEAKSTQLEKEQGPLRESITELKAKVITLEENLSNERKKRTEDCEILAKHLAEQTQIAQNLTQKLEESQGEIAVLRRKQQISVKEMSRELQNCRKRLETYESASPSNSLDQTSRAGSNNSLNTGETLNGGASSDNSGNGESSRQSAELDRQSLIDRILKMQKVNVRRAEKLDFLEEHTRTLVAELQKKTKIIQNYILHENFDAMGSNERDRHKAELARYGGIMASVYSHRVSDENMTLELSLEINQKLQAVLEDALLKNITLKDNIDTLGEEIARLTIINQQLLQQKGK